MAFGSLLIMPCTFGAPQSMLKGRMRETTRLFFSCQENGCNLVCFQQPVQEARPSGSTEGIVLLKWLQKLVLAKKSNPFLRIWALVFSMVHPRTVLHCQGCLSSCSVWVMWLTCICHPCHDRCPFVWCICRASWAAKEPML